MLRVAPSSLLSFAQKKFSPSGYATLSISSDKDSKDPLSMEEITRVIGDTHALRWEFGCRRAKNCDVCS
jgi:hypothetical protein